MRIVNRSDPAERAARLLASLGYHRLHRSPALTSWQRDPLYIVVDGRHAPVARVRAMSNSLGWVAVDYDLGSDFERFAAMAKEAAS